MGAIPGSISIKAVFLLNIECFGHSNHWKMQARNVARDRERAPIDGECVDGQSLLYTGMEHADHHFAGLGRYDPGKCTHAR